MYSPIVIERRRQAVLKHLGWLPERSSPDKISYLKKTIETITRYDEKGNPLGFTETPPDWLLRMRDNEILMCKLDFLYWAQNYAYIRNSSEEIILFPPNRAQKIMLSVWADLEEKGFAIYIINLKARQLGMSSLIELAIAHRIQFYDTVKAVVASSDPRKSERMADMLFLCLAHQPWWLMPAQETGRRGEYAKFTHGPDTYSEIYIEHGSRGSGIARGTTPSVVHLCFAPNTLVHCADGRLKPITEITPDDYIIAGDGTISGVKGVAKSSRHNELSSILSVWGNPIPLETTRDHRIMTPTGYREAKDIKKGEFLAHPVRPIHQNLTGMIIKKFKSGSGGRLGHHTEIPVPLTKDFGFVCGLYLAEGSIGINNKLVEGRQESAVHFSLHEKEGDYMADRLQKGLGDQFSVKRRAQRGGSKTLVLATYHSGLAMWLKENFGSVDGKVVPSWVWAAGEEFCQGLVQGYLEGDGHIPPTTNEICATSIRPAITFQMRDLIASLGWGWCGITYRKEGFWYGRNCQASWTLQIAGATGFNLRNALGYPSIASSWDKESGRHWQYSEDKKQVYLEVGSNVEGFCEEFWDLEVDHPDHNFCTVQCGVANSELPDWEHPKELIDSALMRAIHPDPWKFIILESTAKGLNNWWYYKWQSSQKWPAAKFRPVFLPWFTDEYYWPTPTWLRQNPIPKGWTPKLETLLHAAKAAEAVAATPLLREHFPPDWTLPLHQQWFYENDKEEHIKEDQLAEFLSEMPANDMEAFQSSARSIFSAEVLDFHQSQTCAPVAAYGFVSRLIPVHLQPSALDIDYSYEDDPSAPRPVKIDIRGADEPNTWFTVTLVPLIKDHLLSSSMTLDDEAPFGKLLVYEYPRKWASYGFGVDTAEGIGQDRTVIEGYRKGVLGASRNAQTCEFASPYINSIDLVPILMAIATWYSPIVDGEMQQAKVVIEIAGNGESTQLEMKKRGWSNFHDWLRYDNKITRRSSARKIGWMTRGWSRSLMLDYLIKALKDDWLSISSPWFVKEMRSLGKEDNATKTEAISGAWDDRIMAMAMINLSMWDLELYSGPLDTRMKEVREPQKTYPLLTIPRPTGQRYETPTDYLSGETGWTAPEDEDQGAYAYD